MCLRKQFKVRLQALTELTKDWYTGSTELSWGGEILWLVGWLVGRLVGWLSRLSPDGHCRKQELRDYCQVHE